MNVIALNDVTREEGFIYYFRKYKAIATLKLPTETTDTPILFSIETDPLGRKNIEVKLVAQPNYPALPIINALKTFILSDDDKGLLPI